MNASMYLVHVSDNLRPRATPAAGGAWCGARKRASRKGASTTPAHNLVALCTQRGHQLRIDSVRQETAGGYDEQPPHVTAEMVDDWLRHARSRAANLFYLAGDPSPSHRDRALLEMTQALREALEEVRVVAEELRRETDTRPERSPQEGRVDMEPGGSRQTPLDDMYAGHARMRRAAALGSGRGEWGVPGSNR